MMLTEDKVIGLCIWQERIYLSLSFLYKVNVRKKCTLRQSILFWQLFTLFNYFVIFEHGLRAGMVCATKYL